MFEVEVNDLNSLQMSKNDMCYFDKQLSTEDSADLLYGLHLSSTYAYSVYLDFYRISINFLVNSDFNDIAYHFNPRFDTRILVRNNMVNNVWQQEERSTRRPFVWSRFDSFKVHQIYRKKNHIRLPLNACIQNLVVSNFVL